MKKLIILGTVAVLGIAAFVFNSGTSHNTASASTKDKVVVFGKVDFSDDDDDYEDSGSSKSNDNEETWLEHFIKTHKTPFSKTIHK